METRGHRKVTANARNFSGTQRRSGGVEVRERMGNHRVSDDLNVLDQERQMGLKLVLDPLHTHIFSHMIKHMQSSVYVTKSLSWTLNLKSEASA